MQLAMSVSPGKKGRTGMSSTKLSKNLSTSSRSEENKRKTDDQTSDLSKKGNEVSDDVIRLQIELSKKLLPLEKFKISPIVHVHDPLTSAENPYRNYVQKFCTSKKKILFVGINPTFSGMCQTGVPFGDPKMVAWLEGKEEVSKTAAERSGSRFWRYFRSICKKPEVFFKHSYVYNFCPLVFMDESGSNIAPKRMKVDIRDSLEKTCDEYLMKLVELLQPMYIIAMGDYVEEKIKDYGTESRKILRMPHPANRRLDYESWKREVDKLLNGQKLKQYFVETKPKLIIK